jgi:hypothetical protein
MTNRPRLTLATILTLGAALSLSACATMAQQQFKDMQGGITLARANVKPCFDRVSAVAPLAAAKFSFRPTAAQLADQTRPTPDEAQQVARLSTAITACFTTFRNEVAGADPAVSQPIDQLVFDMNNVDADLIQRRITWGEANRRLYQVFAQDGGAIRSAHDGTVRSLQAQHQAELDQRQRDAEALQAGLANAAVIWAATHPAPTNVYVVCRGWNC